MSTYSGVLMTALALGVSSNVSTDLDNFTVPAAFGTTAVAATVPASGTLKGSVVVPTVRLPAVAGTTELNVGPDWWNRIYVRVTGHSFGTWNRRVLGFLISPQTLTTEVWSAFRFSTQTLTAITPPVGQGVSVGDPYGLPLSFSPLRMRQYSVLVAAAGTPEVDGTVVWDFSGITEPGLELTATRVVAFAFDPDWSQPVERTRQWRTSVLEANDGTEQRIMLRGTPRQRLAYHVLALSARESGALRTLIWGQQGFLFAVPLWMNAATLNANVSAGGVSLTLLEDTATREFTVGDLVLLWTDPYTWEAVTVGAIGANSLTVAALANPWTAKRTRVLPLKFGRVDPGLQFGKPAGWVTSLPVAFDLEVVT